MRKPGNGARPPRAVADPRTHDVLEAVSRLVPQIARSISPDCEVVLHDNRTAPPRILAIGNGHVTQRTTGDLMTRISIGDLDMHDLDEPLFNYSSTAPNGRQLRVSVLPVVVDGRTVAYLAINFATDELLMAQRAIAQLTRADRHPKQIRETFLPKPLPLGELIETCLERFNCPARLLTRENRIDIVRQLEKEGAFRLRGAASEISARLGTSRAAVYNYLKVAKVQAKTQDEPTNARRRTRKVPNGRSVGNDA